MTYSIICGAEIHVELKTKSKMFCGCCNDPFGAPKPNIYTCPVCLGLPGGLPVPNKKAIEDTILLGLALHCEIPEHAHFDRKHYFYPDLPKGYQISQQGEPFCVGGYVDTSYGRVRLNHIHLEEDAAKMHHEVVDGKKVSLIDYNRSSVPLVEIVSEPDIKSTEQAKEFLKNIRDIVRALSISDCDMEKGSMRLEANVSLTQDGSLPPYKVEVKNINSFRFFASAMDYEFKRQEEILNKGETPIQETRGYRAATKSTASQRGKEGSADYRYMPDGDIPPINVSRDWVKEISTRLPKLPETIVAELIAEGVPETAARVIVGNNEMLTFYQTIAPKDSTAAKNLGNALANKKIDISKITSAEYLKSLKAVPAKMSEDETLPLVEQVVRDNPKVVEDYKGGKGNAIGFLVGQVMKLGKGQVDPQIASKLILSQLK